MKHDSNAVNMASGRLTVTVAHEERLDKREKIYYSFRWMHERDSNLFQHVDLIRSFSFSCISRYESLTWNSRSRSANNKKEAKEISQPFRIILN
eukprot:scaffold912_cov187-Ochromonas_danica.AAC.17